MAADIATLPEARSAGHARRGHGLRRIGMVVLWLFLLAGVTGQLGVRTATARDLGGEVDLTVTHAAVTRAGLAYEFDPPPGATLHWSFDVRTSPNQTGSYRHYRVRVVDDSGLVLAEVKHSMLVVP